MTAWYHLTLASEERAPLFPGDALRLAAIRAVAEAEVQPARARPVAGRDHMCTLLNYVLTQTAHHGIPVHPALWAGSCLPDLLGARVIPGLDMKLLLDEPSS